LTRKVPVVDIRTTIGNLRFNDFSVGIDTRTQSATADQINQLFLKLKNGVIEKAP
jgi:hypothetical protein